MRYEAREREFNQIIIALFALKVTDQNVHKKDAKYLMEENEHDSVRKSNLEKGVSEGDLIPIRAGGILPALWFFVNNLILATATTTPLYDF